MMKIQNGKFLNNWQNQMHKVTYLTNRKHTDKCEVPVGNGGLRFSTHNKKINNYKQNNLNFHQRL